VSALNRRIRNMEDEMEQLSTKLKSTNEKLEDIAKAADESERSIYTLQLNHITFMLMSPDIFCDFVLLFIASLLAFFVTPFNLSTYFVSANIGTH